MKFGNIRAVGVVIATGSAIVTGSAQVSYSGLTGTPSGIVSGSGQIPSLLPSGVVSGSAQTLANLPSGTVSGSAQVDVLSTTNIARLATTGSNTFQGSQTISVGGSTEFNVQQSGVTIGNIVTDTHRVTGSIFLSGSLTTTSNVGIGISDLGPDGLSLPGTFNYSWSEGSGNAYAVLFRQRNSAATVIASGYKRSNSASFASSYGISMARAAIAVGYNNGSIAFFSDTASNVANGTDITPTEKMTLNSSGNLTVTGTINGLSIPNDLFAQQFLLMGA
jgi:hypothetical protein